MFNRIRLSLTAWYVGVLLIIVGVVALFTYTLLSRSLSSEVDDSLRDSATNVAAQLNDEALSRVTQGLGPGQSSVGAVNEEGGEGLRFFNGLAGDTFYLILSPDGQSLSNPLNVRVPGIPDVSSAQQAVRSGEQWRTVSSNGSDYRLYSVPIVENGQTLAVVQVGRSLAEHERQLRSLLLVLLAGGIGGLALAAIGGLLVAGRALRPVRDAFQRQRAFVADASHELRTPLTLVHGNAELLALSPTATLTADDRDYLTEIVAETEHIERLVADMATLARMDEGQLTLQLDTVDIASLVDEVVRQGRVLAGDRHLEIEGRTDGPLLVQGDRARLRELLLALIDNAVRYTPDGGRIEVGAQRLPGHVEVCVSDTGEGIQPQHLPRLFERFYRADSSRSRARGGTGLGLSIARGIAEAHGGSLAVSSQHGHGTTFTLALPA